MKTLLALLLLSTSALAADLPVRKATPVAAVDNWTGLYVGINGGMNLGSFSPTCNTCGPADTEVNLDDNNWLVGGHMAYLVQYGSLVVGPEIGIQYWGIKKEADIMAGPPIALLQQNIDWSAYMGARVGLAISPSILPYIGGGVAWAHVKGSIDVTPVLAVTNNALGWYVAGGVELRVTKDIIIGAEYRHIDFGSQVPAIFLPPDRLTVDQITGRVSLKLN